MGDGVLDPSNGTLNQQSRYETVKPYQFANDPDEKWCRDHNLETSGLYNGMYGNHVKEIKTSLETTKTELLLENPYVNCFILLGKDRDAHISSGTGGRGHTGASCIDIVAGHMGYRPIASFIDPMIEQEVNVASGKDFTNDSSRLYLSQKTENIDKYFQIPVAYVTVGNNIIPLENNTGLAAAALKSDCVRIIGRENIKIVTVHGEQNALGKNPINGGIAILAGAEKIGSDPRYNPQPMVKGNNLANALKYIITLILNTNSAVSNILRRQMIINDYVAHHTHQTGAVGDPTSPMLELQSSIENFQFNMDDLPQQILRQIDYDHFDKNFLRLDDPNSIFSMFNVVN